MRKSRDRAKRRHRYSREEREQFVELWRRSGLSQSHFARKHGIHANNLSRWKTEFGETSSAPATIVPLHVIEDVTHAPLAPAGAFEVRLPSGVVLTVPDGFDRQCFKALLDDLGFPRC